jgi:cell division protein FtsL
MAQINLLKQKTASQNFWEILPSLLVKILVLVVVVIIGYYGWLYLQINSINKSIAQEQKDFSEAGQQVNAITSRNEIYTRQAQLQQLNSLIGKHLYWSNIFPVLAEVTLKKASYSSIKITKDGTLTLSVTVPDLDSVDKFIQVFDQPEFYKNFSNLKLGAFHQIGNNQPGFQFEAVLDFSQSILKYQDHGS